MNIHVGSATDVGRARQANEDSYLRDDDDRVFAVADGMGGHRAGDIASATALEAFEARLADGDSLGGAIEAANAKVFAKAQTDPDMRGMGTTVTAVQFDEETALVGHVGDSRAYLLRDGDLTQVTEDHSLVEELVREGRLSREEAAVHPQRSIITRALGVDESVDVDVYEIDLRPADRILVCSDGLTSMVRDEEIARMLRGETDPQATAHQLVDAANRAGGEDNITVLVIDVEGDEEAERRRSLAASQAVEPTAGEPTGEWERAEVPEPGETGEAEPEPRAPMARRLRRAAVWIVPVVFVVGVAAGALGWYARSTYFVGLDDERVVLYRGVPDGFLIWNPTLEESTRVRAADLTDAQRDDLKDGHRFSSRSGAAAFVRRLESATTTSTTSTTAPPPPGVLLA